MLAPKPKPVQMTKVQCSVIRAARKLAKLLDYEQRVPCDLLEFVCRQLMAGNPRHSLVRICKLGFFKLNTSTGNYFVLTNEQKRLPSGSSLTGQDANHMSTKKLENLVEHWNAGVYDLQLIHLQSPPRSVSKFKIDQKNNGEKT